MRWRFKCRSVVTCVGEGGAPTASTFFCYHQNTTLRTIDNRFNIARLLFKSASMRCVLTRWIHGGGCCHIPRVQMQKRRNDAQYAGKEPRPHAIRSEWLWRANSIQPRVWRRHRSKLDGVLTRFCRCLWQNCSSLTNARCPRVCVNTARLHRNERALNPRSSFKWIHHHASLHVQLNWEYALTFS